MLKLNRKELTEAKNWLESMYNEVGYDLADPSYNGDVIEEGIEEFYPGGLEEFKYDFLSDSIKLPE